MVAFAADGTTTPPAATDIFSSVTSSDLGVNALDIIQSGLSLVTVLAPIILIGLAISLAPRFIRLLRGSTGGGNNKS